MDLALVENANESIEGVDISSTNLLSVLWLIVTSWWDDDHDELWYLFGKADEFGSNCIWTIPIASMSSISIDLSDFKVNLCGKPVNQSCSLDVSIVSRSTSTSTWMLLLISCRSFWKWHLSWSRYILLSWAIIFSWRRCTRKRLWCDINVVKVYDVIDLWLGDNVVAFLNLIHEPLFQCRTTRGRNV